MSTTMGKVLAVLLVCVSAPAAAQVFYSVQSPAGESNWLLGTLHSEDPRVLDFPPVLEQALIQADTIALEMVPNEDMLETLDAAMRLPDGESLREHLGGRLYRKAIAALEDYGIEAADAANMRPWAVAMKLALPPAETGLFMDMTLAVKGRLRGAELAALETLDEQLGFITGLGEAAHLRMLETALADLADREAAIESLVAAYQAGRLEELQELALEEFARMGPRINLAFRRRGLVERNHRMAARAQALLDKGNTLVAVGALHLPGEHGLIALLRKQGNRVEAIY